VHKLVLLTLIGISASAVPGSAAVSAEPASPLLPTLAKPDQPKVTGVSVVSEDGWTRLRVETDRSVAPKVFVVRRPAHAVVVDIRGVWGGKTSSKRVRANGVTVLRYGQFNKTCVRVVANCSRAMAWKLVRGGKSGGFEVWIAEAGHPVLGAGDSSQPNGPRQVDGRCCRAPDPASPEPRPAPKGNSRSS
jgi:hypothetical protein